MTTTLATEMPVAVARNDFETMLAFARTVFALKDNPAYLSALDKQLPAAARVDTRWPSVLMGYDFHLTDEGPKLIEINNNAGGLYVGNGRWMPQPPITELKGTIETRLNDMFHSDWESIAIMDEDVTSQYMYPEMLAYAELLERAGRKVVLVNPEHLELTGQGLCFDGRHIDAIYNRHTDFYLETPELAHIRTAYEKGLVAVNPHPRSYALIGDKSRMVDWWRPGLLESVLPPESIALIRHVTPQSCALSEIDAENIWQERKSWVFKPAARHGGKGVVLGKGITRKRFGSLDASETIVQQLVPASEIEVGGLTQKFDLRLYMHGTTLIGVAGRVWRGQVTNFREAGSGWVVLDIV